MLYGIQIAISIALVILILLQERSSGLSGLLGGEGAGGFYHARRGLEKIIFWGTIVLVALFVIVAILQIAY